MAITRYIGFVLLLIAGTFTAAFFDAKMKGDVQPTLRIAFPISLPAADVDARRFMQQVESYLEQVRLDEFWQTIAEKSRSLGPSRKDAQ